MKKNSVSLSFMLLGIVFCVCLIASNLLETKIIQIGSFTITAGFLVFPVSYIINDCIAEVWGFRKARLIIWLGFAMNCPVPACPCPARRSFLGRRNGVPLCFRACPPYRGRQSDGLSGRLLPQCLCHEQDEARQ